MKEKSRKIMWGITGVLVFVSVLVIYKTHRELPFMMDDLWYSTMLSDETPIASFSDIVKSQIWHYNNWGGRSLTHGILQITLLLGEHAADILNVVMTLLLSAVICVTARHRSLPAFWAAMAMLLGLNANWRMSMFWQAGAANYLYITVFILLFAWCYLREVPERRTAVSGKEASVSGEGAFALREGASAPGEEAFAIREGASAQGEGAFAIREGASVPGKRAFALGEGASALGEEPFASQENGIVPEKDSADRKALCNGNRAGGTETALPKHLRGITLWIIPLGILAGWSNENMGPAVWLLSLAVMALTVREKRRLPLWMILGSISCLAGSIMVIAAPGNFVRNAQVASNEYGFLWQCFLRGYAESTAVAVYLFPVLLVLGFMAVLCRGVLKQELGRQNILLLLCALLSWGAMVLSPHYPDRAAFGTMVFLICVTVSLAKKILSVRKDLAWMLWGMTALIWLRGMYYCGEYLAITWGWIK